MKRSVIGILAHVDAGKTTLSEAMLYLSGAKDKLGRVDRRDSLFDNHSIERERGITVFSKQAELTLENTALTLIDTPGHVDFSCEAERSLSVQDYAILVISAPEGVTAHTVTLYNLLLSRGIPTFIFCNKTDIAERRRIDIIDELRRAFGSGVVDFGLERESPERFFEECAGADEALMEGYFETGEVDTERLKLSIKTRRILPTVFGSALKCEGVSTLLSLIDRYTLPKRYSKTTLGAKIYKIMTDPDGTRLTCLKVTGGSISVKDTISYIGDGGRLYTEKVESIRLYSADKYKAVRVAEAGGVYAVVGLNHTRAGGGIGSEIAEDGTLEPVLDYRMIFGEGTDIHEAYLAIKPLAEEEPSLSMRYDRESREIRVKLMGDIQTEVLTRMIRDRFGYEVSFSEGSILYRETIAERIFGAGHFEPLMHYAEVRLRLEPLPRGSGTVFTSNCPTDRLRTNWQRLILSHLEEKAHVGTLTGSPITDMKITLIAGRAHPKHTEGGDFREATYRALRQGLMKARSVLLEPIFDFELELPEALVGRAMTDIANMHGECEPPEFTDGRATLVGSCPVATMRSYAKELRAYSKGEGKLSLSLSGYRECHNSDEVIAARGYSPELDSSVTADSVFCKGGAGYAVPWYEADEKMHTENPEETRDTVGISKKGGGKGSSYRGTVEEDRELMRIFESTYGKIKPRAVAERTENAAPTESPLKKRKKLTPKGDDYVIIDGYNLIFAWDELRSLAERELAHARDTLIHILCNYRGFKKCKVILVFDAYKRRDNDGSVEEIGGISVVYTKERQTADAYIEKCAYSLADKNSVRVVTSDYEEQLIVLGVGATRHPTREFIEEVETVTDMSNYS